MNDNFYAAPQAELELPPRLPAELRSNKATRGSRLGAALIDGVIVFGVSGLALRVIGVVPMVGPLFSLVDVLMICGEERRCVHD
jgi:uncharacterized RDD family membrane protein YckC